MENFHFSINGTWQGDRNGIGHIRSEGGIDVDVSVPKEFDGPGIGGTPEDFLISAANNCYMITLAAMLSNRKIPLEKFEVNSEGVLEREGGKLNFKQIIHRPKMYISTETGVSKDSLIDITDRALKACFMTNTLKCSIDFTVETEVVEK